MNKKKLSVFIIILLILFPVLNVQAAVTEGDWTAGKYGGCPSMYCGTPLQDTYYLSKYTGTSQTVTLPTTIAGKPVKSIMGSAAGAIGSNSNVKKVIVPEGYVELGYRAFYNNPNLSELVIPESLQIIDQNYSVNNPKLNFTVPSSFAKMPDNSYRKVEYIETTISYEYSRAIETFNALNDFRKKNGLGALLWNGDMGEQAMDRAVEVAYNFSHTRPNGTGSNYIAYNIAGKENIAFAGSGYINGAGVISLWSGDEGHKEPMLSTSNKSVAIGYVFNPTGSYVVAEFSSMTPTNTSYKTGTMDKTTRFQINDTLRKTVSFSLKYPEQSSGKLLTYVDHEVSPEYIRMYNTSSDFNSSILNGIYANPNSAKYTSSNTSIFTVDSNGKITAKGKGTATLTAKIGNETQTLEVEVKENIKATRIYVDIPEENYQNGKYVIDLTKRYPFTVKFGPDGAIPEKYTITRSDSSVLDIDNGNIAPFKYSGTCTVTLTSESGLTTSIDIVITSAAIKVSEIVTGDIPTNMLVGEKFSIEGISVLPTNATDKTILTSTGNSNILKIEGNDVIAVAEGQTFILFRANGASKSIVINVRKKVDYIKGDLNKSNNIDLGDVLKLLKMYFKSITYTEEDKTIADMDSNGEIELKDILMLLKEFFKS